MRGKDFIRYHPLINVGGDNMELMPLFRHTDIRCIENHYGHFLSEMVNGYYRLHCSKPLSNRQIRAMTIHCPSCGNTLTGISDADTINNIIDLTVNNHEIYICKRCKKSEDKRL